MAWKSLTPRPRVLAACLIGCAALAFPVQAQTPDTVGQWSGLIPNWPSDVTATHAHLQPDGKVMFFGEFSEGDRPPRRWDPATSTFSTLPDLDYNVFCAGHSYLADGQLLFTGGHDGASHLGLPDASLYNAFTASFTRITPMRAGRWYPTNTTLPNGDVMVLSGEIAGAGDINEIPERYVAASQSWVALTGARLRLALYPRTFLAPNGRLFVAGPSRTTRWMANPMGAASWTTGPSSNFGTRSYGPAVFIDGKVYLFGGGDPPTATVEQIDLTATTPTWRYMRSMLSRRRQHNATLLPDGKVLVTGGSSGSGFDNSSSPVRFAEVYDPVANTWTRLSSNTVYRGYHATALLLPDGRVLSAGGRNRRSGEIFSPPYLFKGARPTISSAPTTVTPGTSFSVSTPDAAGITKVTIIRPGSVTHAFDQDQRLLTLSFTRGTSGLTISAPANNNLAPPGYYQLFLVNSRGVPSVGRMIRITTTGTLAE